MRQSLGRVSTVFLSHILAVQKVRAGKLIRDRDRSVQRTGGVLASF